MYHPPTLLASPCLPTQLLGFDRPGGAAEEGAAIADGDGLRKYSVGMAFGPLVAAMELSVKGGKGAIEAEMGAVEYALPREGEPGRRRRGGGRGGAAAGEEQEGRGRGGR